MKPGRPTPDEAGMVSFSVDLPSHASPNETYGRAEFREVSCFDQISAYSGQINGLDCSGSNSGGARRLD
jgi:hypothetical protein